MCVCVRVCVCVLCITNLHSVLTLTEVHVPCSADPPQFSPATTTVTPTEGEQLAISYSLNANPPVISDNITLTKNSALVTDTRVTVTATSLTIASVTRDDSGEYQVTARNVVGSGTFALTVNMYCECTDIASMYTSLIYLERCGVCAGTAGRHTLQHQTDGEEPVCEYSKGSVDHTTDW